MTDIFPGPEARTWPGPQQAWDDHMAWHLKTHTLRTLVRDNQAAFARLLKRQRESFGMNGREAAKHCEVTHSVLAEAETCAALPTAISLSKIMEGLCLTRDDLLAEIRALEDEQAVSHEAA